MSAALPWRADSYETYDGIVIHRVLNTSGAEIARCASREMADAMCWTALRGPGGMEMVALIDRLETQRLHYDGATAAMRARLTAEIIELSAALARARETVNSGTPT